MTTGSPGRRTLPWIPVAVSPSMRQPAHEEADPRGLVAAARLRDTGPVPAELGIGGSAPEVLGVLLVGGVLWKPGRESVPGVLGEVELEAVVGTLLPERGDAVVALQDEERQALLPQAGGQRAEGPRR
ncbi:hypothetical protein ZWY2020_028716 [Hordeum vulgare]|nr:hypothetical protein ZWY2020_028716 [Hordeum vulgare]